MPFGLRNAFSTFHPSHETVIQGLLYIYIYIYV